MTEGGGRNWQEKGHLTFARMDKSLCLSSGNCVALGTGQFHCNHGGGWLGAGIFAPFDREAPEFHAQAKATACLRSTINDSSYLRKTPSGDNNRLFARTPGALADDASAVWTDVFRKRSLRNVGLT
jgi:hypothetical protein